MNARPWKIWYILSERAREEGAGGEGLVEAGASARAPVVRRASPHMLRILDSGKWRSRFFMSSYRLSSMNSNTKKSSSFSRITSLSLTMFGWFSFLSDCGT